MTDESQSCPWSPEEYDRLAGFSGDWRDSWWNEDFLQLMAHRWRLRDVRRLLDVGCGAGHWGQRLARYLPQDAKLFGVDAVHDFTVKARERAGEPERGLAGRSHVATAGFERLPFADNSFDAVTCQTVLMHVASAEAAVQEALRVLRPGGLLAVAEPNNMANSLVFYSAEPKPSWQDTEAMLRFQAVCEAGKKMLGRGEHSIGDRLPGIFNEAGLQNIQAYTSDRSPFLVPPYDAPEQKLDLEQWIGFYEADIWPVAGHRQDARQLYLAGGGAEAEFEANWQRVMSYQRGFLGAVAEGRYHGGRGFLFYLVSGRKPE